MSIESKIEELTISRNTIRNKMIAANQATRTDKLSTLASNLSIQAGIDTSDATATADDILEGQTAYVDGEKITGRLGLATSSDISLIVEGAWDKQYDQT